MNHPNSASGNAAPNGGALRRRQPLAAAVLCGLASMPAARAATIVVTTAGDTNPAATGTCTLRQAVLSMNNSTLSGNCANTGAAFGTNDTINFAPAIGTITLADAANNELHVTAANLTIDAGVGRTVTVERPAAATKNFSLILAQGQSLSLSGLVLKNGYANHTFYTKKYSGTSGGAVYASSDLTLTRCSIVGNSAPDWGGGVFVNNHRLTIRDSAITGNASRQGSGVAMLGGRLTMLDSEVSGNTGGAISGVGSTLYLRNATLSGNSMDTVTKYGRASAILAYGSTLTVVSSTIACNDSLPLLASDHPAAVVGLHAASMTLINTVAANTTNQACTTSTYSDFYTASSISIHGDHNLVTQASNAVFDTPPMVGDPRLQPLANNGGPTRTHALALNSPALNSGANPTGIVYDQRGAGFPRESGFSADIGAFEVQNPTFCGAAHRQAFANLTSGSPNLCAAGTDLLNFSEGTSPSSWWTWICGQPPDYITLSGCFAYISTATALSVRNTSDVPITTAVYGQPLRLRQTVTGQYGGSMSVPAPTGTVSFYDATNLGLDAICANVPLSTYCATPTGLPPAGTRKLQAIYNGDTKYGKSSSALSTITIQPAISTTGIASRTPNPVALGSSYTVVAQVQVNAPSQAMPSGDVEVRDETDNLSCTYNLAAQTPGCAITPASAGTHALRVTYFGDGGGNINGSQATGSETVTAPLLGLALSDGTAFARYGQTLQYTVTLTNTGTGAANGVTVSGTPSANFNGATVQWQCVGSNGATCASGSGATLSDNATLPANSAATWAVSIVVPANAGGASVQFDVTAAGLPTVGDADTLVLFRDGFD